MDRPADFPTVTERSVERLNALLRGEISAVETFTLVIARFGAEAPHELDDCLRSHQLRVEKLTVRVSDLGCTPAVGSGLWGSLAKLVEGGATLFGLKSALLTLEEGEDHGVARYRERLDDLDVDEQSRRLIQVELMPEQLKTDYVVRDLCRSRS